MEVSSLPYFFYYIYSGIVWEHYQWISKLLTQIALCEHVYDNGKQLLNRNFSVKIWLSSNPTTNPTSSMWLADTFWSQNMAQK